MKERSLVFSKVHLATSFFEATASKTLLRFACLAAFGLSSCVPAKSYDQARSAAETEIDAHRRTRSRLEAAHQRIRALEQTLAERQKALESGASSIAEAKLQTTVANKDKDAAIQLVEQLRSELARTGNHLLVFSDEKRELARALSLAEERVRNIEAAERNLSELVAVARDASLALGPALDGGAVTVGARDGQVVLSIPADRLFARGSDALVVEAAPLLAAVGSISAAHQGLGVIVREPSGAPHATERSARLGAALRERGVPDSRLVLPSRAPGAEEPVTAPAAAEPAPPNAAPEGAPAEAAAASESPVDEGALRYEIAFAI